MPCRWYCRTWSRSQLPRAPGPSGSFSPGRSPAATSAMPSPPCSNSGQVNGHAGISRLQGGHAGANLDGKQAARPRGARGPRRTMRRTRSKPVGPAGQRHPRFPGEFRWHARAGRLRAHRADWRRSGRSGPPPRRRGPPGPELHPAGDAVPRDVRPRHRRARRLKCRSPPPRQSRKRQGAGNGDAAAARADLQDARPRDRRPSRARSARRSARRRASAGSARDGPRGTAGRRTSASPEQVGRRNALGDPAAEQGLAALTLLRADRAR